MNSAMTWTSGWNSIVVIDDFIQPCNFTVTVHFSGTDNNFQAQHIAYRRIQYFIEEIMNETILIHHSNELMPVLKKFRAKLVCLSNEPLDLIVAGALWSKIEKITQGNLLIEYMNIKSDMSEDIVNNLDEDTIVAMREDALVDIFAPHGETIWWNRSDAGTCDDIAITVLEDGLVQADVKLDCAEWPEHLQWEYANKPVDDTDKDNIVSIKDRKKWKPEVIKGDKT